MMLAGPELKAVPVTIHIPLREVAAALSVELIVETGTDRRRPISGAALRIARRASLSPGSIPTPAKAERSAAKTRQSSRPAVAALRAEGIAATGPFSADTMFHPAARAGYDAALVHVPRPGADPGQDASFSETVNVTLGLAFVRTSPDHGTALDIAGTGKANPSSLAAALRLAAELGNEAPSKRAR